MVGGRQDQRGAGQKHKDGAEKVIKHVGVKVMIVAKTDTLSDPAAVGWESCT